MHQFSIQSTVEGVSDDKRRTPLGYEEAARRTVDVLAYRVSVAPDAAGHQCPIIPPRTQPLPSAPSPTGASARWTSPPCGLGAPCLSVVDTALTAPTLGVVRAASTAACALSNAGH